MHFTTNTVRLHNLVIAYQILSESAQTSCFEELFAGGDHGGFPGRDEPRVLREDGKGDLPGPVQLQGRRGEGHPGNSHAEVGGSHLPRVISKSVPLCPLLNARVEATLFFVHTLLFCLSILATKVTV